MQQHESAKSAKEIVLEYLDAVARHDFESARSYLKDNVTYWSPLNSFDNADAYLKYNFSLHLAKLDIKKTFTDGDDVCLFHETTLTKPPATVFTAIWCHIDGGKISSVKVLFDPRPFVRPER
ncbi:MAG: nuclear transport factor 2 family protein [Nitrososphaera sp.]